MSHNRFLSEIFENLDVDYQMLISLGKNEPFYRPKNQFFSHAIGVYFISFFIEHPVYVHIVVTCERYSWQIPPKKKLSLCWMMRGKGQCLKCLCPATGTVKDILGIKE